MKNPILRFFPFRWNCLFNVKARNNWLGIYFFRTQSRLYWIYCLKINLIKPTQLRARVIVSGSVSVQSISRTRPKKRIGQSHSGTQSGSMGVWNESKDKWLIFLSYLSYSRRDNVTYRRWQIIRIQRCVFRFFSKQGFFFRIMIRFVTSNLEGSRVKREI